jgi:hypothetical protein
VIRACIFCGRAGLSREHVWPEWSHKLARKSPGAKSDNSRHWARPSYSGPYEQIQSEDRQGDVTSSRLRVVCEHHCNNGWMSGLESRSKPILTPLITGRHLALNKYNQEILSTWIATRMLVAEFLYPRDVFSSAEDRSLVMGRRLPPDRMKIWIGLLHGNEC